MTRDLVLPFARLRAALYNPSPQRRPGKCLVNQADLELLLAEVEQLSNAQMARYLTRLVLEELRNGESTTETDPGRAVEGRRRRNHPVHRAARSAADRRVAEVAGPFVFGDEISIPAEHWRLSAAQE